MDVDYIDNNEYEMKNVPSCSNETERNEAFDCDIGTGLISGNEQESGCPRTDNGTENGPLCDIDIMQLEFSSAEEALQWYTRYTKCVGFGVRKDDCGRDSRGRYYGVSLCVARKGQEH